MIQKFKLWLFFRLLVWYSKEELDQWDMFKVSTKYGMVYVTISRKMTETGYYEFHYNEIS